MLCTLGDLLDDVVVWLEAPVVLGTDTPARTFRRRGGSAANVAAFVAALGSPARFIGQVGDDPAGRGLVSELAAAGVDVRVHCAGRTGSVVVLVTPGGERTMLTDRASAVDLAGVPEAWLTDVGALHLPAYSLVVEPLASTALAASVAARSAGALVSVDASSVRALATYGPTRFLHLLDDLAPDVLLANEEEAGVLGLDTMDVRSGSAVAPLVVVKRGGRSAVVSERGRPAVEVPARPIDAVADTTGAGDAFAAGLLVSLVGGADAVAAAAAGHDLAAAVLGQPGAALPAEVG